MRDQFNLIRKIPWKVLIILDACRADAFEPYRKFGDYQTVIPPASCTEKWVQAVGPWMKENDVLYFSGNPVVDRAVRKYEIHLRRISIWKEHWGYFTPLSIPTIHPMSVASVGLTYIDIYRNSLFGTLLEPPRYVFHFMQPHCPYIGAVPLAIGRAGGGKHRLFIAVRSLRRPTQAVASGDITWKDVRVAYDANLALVWEAVQVIGAAMPDERIVVTADHGNMLGEDGRFGHRSNWRYPELMEVPWLDTTGRRLAGRDVSTTLKKLEALGYV